MSNEGNDVPKPPAGMGIGSRRVTRRGVLGILGTGLGAGLLAEGCSEPARGALRDSGMDPHNGGMHADAESGAPSSPGDAGDSHADAAPGCAPTTADVEGPYYLAGAPSRTQIAGSAEPGERLLISGRVLGPDCVTPLAGALIDVWQADKDGVYHGAEAEYRLRGQMLTDADGSYEFETVMPGQYALGSSFRPAHVHFMVSRPGHAPLTTQLYFQGDPFLPPNDPCGTGCNSDEPDRVVAVSGAAPLRATFDIVLART